MKEFLRDWHPAFVGYITAGFPDRNSNIEVLSKSCKAGLDILEIGFPARDPSCDGEVIREAQKRVDRSVAMDMTYWREVRNRLSVPIWLMGYKNDLLENDVYLKLAEEKLYDALVIPDLNDDEFEMIQKKLETFGVEVVGFINPSQSMAEVQCVVKRSHLIYHQLYCGMTGQTHNDSSYLPLMNYARQQGARRLFAGFGINTPERAAELAESGFDGVIIGSAIMKHLLTNEADTYAFISEVKKQLSEGK